MLKSFSFWACLAASCAISSASFSAPVRPQDVYVIDGDTIDVEGQRYRLVGFDTPETWKPKCNFELQLGKQATARLRTLVTSGQILEINILPGKDKYGRGLAKLLVGGADVGDILRDEGLARSYTGGKRQEWC
ncbi:nuclease homologue [Epibacterium ulvae]|uniref:Nuclease homologue n=1 Tax=Epibacterium ulvae TaxID=1156985 RepID=A0A1G5RHL3_9RHOB|nr:nuclease homologue [Epibacterium ulvae]